jgi:hypothetical protein
MFLCVIWKKMEGTSLRRKKNGKLQMRAIYVD